MKKMHIMRGLPGSGKSTLAKTLVDDEAQIVSADKFFFSRGKGGYAFDASLLGQAHHVCEQECLRLVEQGKDVVVDNVHALLEEMRPYVDMAQEHGYEIHVHMPDTPWAWEPEECAKHNTKGVPLTVIQNQLNRFEHIPTG